MKKSNYFLISSLSFFVASCVLLILKAYDIANEESYQIKQILLIISTILYVASLLIYLVMRFGLKK
jgi:predicted permease